MTPPALVRASSSQSKARPHVCTCRKEQERYRAEGIQFENVEYANNDAVIQLIEPSAISGAPDGPNILTKIQEDVRVMVAVAILIPLHFLLACHITRSNYPLPVSIAGSL